MGYEFGQRHEWNHERSQEWHLLEYQAHQGIRRWVQDLNRFYRLETALYERDFESECFEWIQYQDAEKSIVSFLRKRCERIRRQRLWKSGRIRGHPRAPSR